MSINEIQLNHDVLDNNTYLATSERYNVIKTNDVIARFRRHGFEISEYREAGVRTQERVNKQRHMVRMSIDSHTGLRRDVVIFNSYDSSTSLRLNFGAFRAVCMNTLCFGDSLLEEMRIKHTSLDPFYRIDEYADMLLSKLDEEKALRERMKSKELTYKMIHDLAERALAIREDNLDKILDPSELIITRRYEDSGKKLWKVYNRIQEALVNGLYQKEGYVTNPDTQEKVSVFKKAKELRAPNEIIRVNKELHNICAEMVA
jgi:hypothetical protein